MFSGSVAKHAARILHLNRVVSHLRFSGAAATCQEGTTKFMDAFQVLNLDRKFDIPQEAVKQSYRSLMANLHPDKHHGKSIEEQETLREKASEVTQSYQILKEAPTRATHMLKLFGKVEDMEESSMKELLGAAQGNMLLMEVMEIREAVDEAKSDEELRPLLQENDDRIDSVCTKLADAFAEKDLDQALELTVMLQYYNRIDETIRNKMDAR